MRYTQCLILAAGCALIAAVLHWLAIHPASAERLLWPGAAALAEHISELSINGAVAFVALTFYAGAKASSDERARLRERETSLALNEIYGRIHNAKKGVEALYRIQCDPKSNLPHDGVESFSSIAAFCSSWIQPERKRRCDQTLIKILARTNHALFSFIVALEVSKAQATPNLNGLRDNALACLESVDNEISART